jgi:predicted Zn-dependent protease
MDRHDIRRALERRGVPDWVVIDRDQELAVVDEGTRVRRSERRMRWQIVVHVDTPKGRGSARVAVDAVDGNAESIAEQAVALASATIGPAWSQTPDAAPARVALVDDVFGKLSPVDAAAEALHAARPANTTITASARYLRERVTAIAHGGFHTTWQAGLVHVDALVAAGDHSIAVSRSARRRDELDLDHALADAAADADALAKAGAPSPGPCALVLSGDVLAEAWRVFAHQADAVVERQGLTRYRERMAIVHGADQIAEPLSIASDGALEYGVLSEPLGEDGDAVRRFPIIERGIAIGLGLSPREAALRKRDPNGGVRNLVVAPGTWSGELPPGAVSVLRLRDLAIDPYTGDARLEIALGKKHGASDTWFAGGTVRLDLIATLAHARRSSQRLRLGAYDGPHAILIEGAELL